MQTAPIALPVNIQHMSEQHPTSAKDVHPTPTPQKQVTIRYNVFAMLARLGPTVDRVRNV